MTPEQYAHELYESFYHKGKIFQISVPASETLESYSKENALICVRHLISQIEFVIIRDVLNENNIKKLNFLDETEKILKNYEFK